MNNSQKRLSKFGGLVKWSLLRHRFYIPVFVVVQIIYGFLFITNSTNQAEKSYLCTGYGYKCDCCYLCASTSNC